MEKEYCVYILTNKNNQVLYTGVANNLKRRVSEHKEGKGSEFTRKYQLHKLVYFEVTHDINTAIFRERQIKAGSRQKKLDLIHGMNKEWRDLFEDL